MTQRYLACYCGLNTIVAGVCRQRYRSASARDGALSFRKFPRLHLLAPEKSPHRDMLARLHLLKQNA
ncbi:MAG TPA: hypothetical protein DD850_16445 [Erwinia persicina]|uniref:Uncharacterized protein n=1 Tax=Erwinia persicina TaxID=55211 RepID=A0A3S7S0Y9_9GAMM|nr:hypothetical protein [Erwinia persicina]AXU94371.1 hypothetical protein CI789_03475 [Erwinia persicina]MBD8105699.1 hypothetical protein [Erwinia persicina]MBD8168925.1 hypothetical protein [Erwinia persicina]MBD8209535.1 hypothetical protein [Erwinia persicina]MCQ4093382.1 hypothetical protein [Erwinia persicina]